MAKGKALGVARMRPVDGVHHRDAHRVAVVGRGTDRLAHDVPRMQRAGGHVCFRQARVHGAHHRASADGHGSLAKAEGVADDAAVLRGDAAEGGDGTREVVRLPFDRDDPVVREEHATGVVLEDGDDERVVDAPGGIHQLLEKPQALPGGVVAVVAPALHHDLHLGIREGPASFCLILLEGPHLARGSVPRVLLRGALQLGLRHPRQRDAAHRLRGARGAQGVPNAIRGHDLLDHRVIEHLLGDLVGLGLVDAEELVAVGKARPLERVHAQGTGALQNRGCLWVGDRPLIADLHDRPGCRIEHRFRCAALKDGVDEKRRQALGVHIAFEAVDPLDGETLQARMALGAQARKQRDGLRVVRAVHKDGMDGHYWLSLSAPRRESMPASGAYIKSGSRVVSPARGEAQATHSILA